MIKSEINANMPKNGKRLMQEFDNFYTSLKKPISSCKDLHKYFIGNHRAIPVYLTPKFEMELECIMNKLEDLETKNKKYKEVINKAIKYIEENKQHEYRNGNLDEYYLELNEKEMTELLNILKEVEHE